ncbi:MAG: hypothetical protein HON70_27990, partial [Lentisphaerae bacterium]|nr:hypothetical protein [Lentisphaerota bacterium]
PLPISLRWPTRTRGSPVTESSASRTRVIAPEELLIGDWGYVPIVSGRATPFGNGIRLNLERAAELRRRCPEHAADVDDVVTYWQTWLADNPNRQPLTCHAALAYNRVLELGLDGLRQYVTAWRARNTVDAPHRTPWYDALLIAIQGVSEFINAHAQAATGAADKARTKARRAELGEVADICSRLAYASPRTFHEAVQLFYLLFLVCGHDSPGPVDRMLYPALKRGLAEGTTSLEEAQELVDCLWLKLAGKTAYGATLGGQWRDGTDAANELSDLCLESIRRLRLLSPRTAVRWHPGLSSDFLDRTCAVIAEGTSLPALVNDNAIITAAVERGMRLEDARDYTFVGCGQTYPHGRGHGNYEDVILNAAKPLELALHDGIDPVTGEQAGPATGTPDTFRTYQEFESAYQTQMDTVVSTQIEAINARRKASVGQTFDFLRSLLSMSCIERGLDWHEGGTDYSEGMVDAVGLTTTTDSLLAIRMGVFEQQLLDLPALVTILDANWDGEEALRQHVLRQIPKFGNENPEADDILAAEAHRVNEHIKTHRTCFGGPWGMDIIGWSGAVLLGRQTGATPDGRRHGEPLADCAGPAQGRNTQGLTATINSALRLPHHSSHGPLVLSLRFPERAVQDAEGRKRLRALVESYFLRGGQQLQISVAGTEEMKAAQECPEDHRDLMVRVGGFSAYFVELDACWQDDMITRSEMES